MKPELVGEVTFTEWTRDGTLRHPAFEGLREDKRARDVVREMPANDATSDAIEGQASRHNAALTGQACAESSGTCRESRAGTRREGPDAPRIDDGCRYR